MTREKIFLFILCFLLILCTFSVMGAPKILTVTQPSDALSLDPHAVNANDTASLCILSQIFDTLVRQDADLNILPGLAIAWSQISDLIWEFDLRANVKFHNGNYMTADDVKYSLDRLREPSLQAPGAFIVDFIDEVQVVDSLKVRIITKTPFAPILAHLSHSITGILNRSVVEQVGQHFGQRVVIGTGPFKFVTWSPGSNVILEKNSDYWGEVAKVDRLVFRPIADGTVRDIELVTGEVDIALDVKPADESRLAASSDIKIVRTPSLGIDYIGFNCQKTPFNNVLVRQAVNHAINMDLIIDIVFEGQGVRATSPISPMVWGVHPDLISYDYNPALAKELLKQAGFEDGFSTTLWTREDDLLMTASEIIQADLAVIGIDVDVIIVEWGSFLADTALGKHDMFISAWTTFTADPDYGLYPLFHSKEYGGSGNRTFWSSPQLDRLLEQGRATAAMESRRSIYYEAQEIIAENVPWAFMRAPVNVIGIRSNIKGFEPHPSGILYLNTVDKK